MASCIIMAFVTLMVVALATVGADISPSPSPYIDKICEDVDCGKGKCIVDLEAPFNFKCECESGWNRTRYSDDKDAFQFLPCTIPNCSLDYSCMPASPPSPAPAPAVPYNVSVYDPCHWVYCGEGTCKWIKPYKHTCECRPGYNNALNISCYPCFSDCAIGSDCEKLGVVKSSNATSTPANGGTRATSFLTGNFLLMSILTVSFVIILWK